MQTISPCSVISVRLSILAVQILRRVTHIANISNIKKMFLINRLTQDTFEWFLNLRHFQQAKAIYLTIYIYITLLISIKIFFGYFIHFNVTHFYIHYKHLIAVLLYLFTFYSFENNDSNLIYFLSRLTIYTHTASLLS